MLQQQLLEDLPGPLIHDPGCSIPGIVCAEHGPRAASHGPRGAFEFLPLSLYRGRVGIWSKGTRLCDQWHASLGVRLGAAIEIGRKTLGNMGFRRTPSEAQIETFVDHYNHRRYHESINNLTPR